tara:strand:- start:6518 stop:7075 length:558 start_codon:yes stop_codon:yes gene_type:complete
MFKKVRQYFNLGEQVSFWDSDGNIQHGLIDSPVRRIAGVDCVIIDTSVTYANKQRQPPCSRWKKNWISIDAIDIDGNTAKVRRYKVGRMTKHTGGYFGTWSIGGKCFGVTDWSYEAPSFNRYYRLNGVKKGLAVYVNPRSRHYLYRVYRSDGTLYDEGIIHQRLNESAQIACDILRKYFVEEIMS